MSTPSSLGDLGFQVTTVAAYTTSTARLLVLRLATASDTGTVAVTGRTLDLSRAQHLGTTGGKPLDATVHPRRKVPVWKSAGVVVPLELNFHTSGRSVYVTATHQQASAASGAGSTFETIKTDVKRFKAGTSTDSIFHTGFASFVNTMAIERFYRCNLSFAFKLASSTAAKDTTTEIRLVCNSPSYVLSGGDQPTHVPATVV